MVSFSEFQIYQASRLDVQHHHLKDLRLTHAQMDDSRSAPSIRGRSESTWTILRRPMRAAVTDMLIVFPERVSQKPAAGPLSITR